MWYLENTNAISLPYFESNFHSFECVYTHTRARKEVEEYSKASEGKNDVSDFDKNNSERNALSSSCIKYRLGRKHPVIAERFFARVQIRVKVSFRKALRDHPGPDRDRQREWTVEEKRGGSYSNGDVIKVRMRAIACILHRCMATEHSATRPRMIYSSIQVAGISPFIPVYLEKFAGTRCATWPKIGEKFTEQGANLFFLLTR